MPWQNNGDYYLFRASEIEARAPAAPGVYGLYNFRHHITIGSSENIREALLRHLRQTDFRFRRFQPTGFTFERWPSDLKNARAQQLIFEYNPVMQSPTGIGLRSLLRSWSAPGACAFQIALGKTPRDTRGEGQRLRLAPAICGLLVPVAALFTLIPDLQSAAHVLVAGLSSVFNRNISVAHVTRISVAAPNREAGRARQQATPLDEGMGKDQHPTAPLESQKQIGPPLKNSTTGVVRVSPTESMGDTAAVAPVSALKHWTVQVFATPAKKIADSWMEKLELKGYDAFVTAADVGGRTWYRVRVGHFKIRADALSLSARMRLEEGFGDAFVTRSTKSEPLALKRDAH